MKITRISALSIVVAAAAALPARGGVNVGTTGGLKDVVDKLDAKAAAASVRGPFSLSITIAGGGNGTVTSLPAGINCGSVCAASYAAGVLVTLTETPVGGSTFSGWSGGGCSGTGACVVAMSAAQSVTATFASAPGSAGTTVTMNGAQAVTATFNLVSGDTLTLKFAGSGGGSVVEANSGLACSAACATRFAANAIVELTATPGTGSVFSGFSGGGCSAEFLPTTCFISPIGGAQTVTATFISGYALTAAVQGTGGGAVTSAPAGIDCASGACSYGFASGAAVTLNAAPAAGSVFAGWSGACSGTGACMTTMSAARAVVATFNVKTGNDLSVQFGGAGGGTVEEYFSGFVFTASGSEIIASSAPVELFAQATPGSVFAGFSGAACEPALLPTYCAISSMTASQVVAATFIAGSALTVVVQGTGGGAVTSSPGGIDCTAGDCAYGFAAGTQVTLTAKANSASVFAGWSGGVCAGTGVCTTTVSSAQEIVASFNVVSGVSLNVAFSGTGSGSVVEADSGLACSSDCTDLIVPGGGVELLATAAAGSVFVGWTGTGCDPAELPAACVIDAMNAAQTVTAEFASGDALTVTEQGTGGGGVTSSPAGLDCAAASCSYGFEAGSRVTLTAAADSSSTFAGWSGTGVAALGAPSVRAVPANSSADAGLERSIGKMVSKALGLRGGIGLFAATGLKTAGESILSDDFLRRLHLLPSKTRYVEALIKTLRRLRRGRPPG
ncbi:MAG: hypothetical protein ACHQ49_09325 [Elusimicrobiota bacterium]